MHKKSQETERRNRIEKVSEVLRKFGLVDRFGLNDLFLIEDFPTIKTIEKYIDQNKDYLPTGLSSKYLAKVILSKIKEPSPELAAWQHKHGELFLEFKNISTGKRSASTYHNHIFALLKAIFDGFLDNPKKEQSSGNKLGFIDIVFDNIAEDGFFSRLRRDHNIPCSTIPIECKNYSDDLTNTEYNQLYSRLKKDCCFGILICRRITDKKKSLAHCKEAITNNKYMIVLDDNDISLLFNLRKKGKDAEIDNFWGQKFRDLIL